MCLKYDNVSAAALLGRLLECIPQELDFELEAENAQRCDRNFRRRSSRVGRRVHIPKISRDLCSRRVITMEYIRGKSEALSTWQ